MVAGMAAGVMPLLAAALLAAGPAAAGDCLTRDRPGELSGLLRIGAFKDAADRPQSAYIVDLDAPACLADDDPEFAVDSALQLHVYSPDGSVHDAIHALVGRPVTVTGKAFAAHTGHHHAPIVMDVSEIAGR